MKKESKNFIYGTVIVMSIILVFQIGTIYFVKPYLMTNFGLNAKGGYFVIILCYISALYGIISAIIIKFLEKKFKK